MAKTVTTNNPFRRYRQVLGEGGWAFFGQASIAVGMVLQTRIITEVVQPAVWGQFTLILSAIYLLRSIFCQPVYMALLRFFPDVASAPAPLRQVCKHTLKRNLTIAVFVILVGGAIWSRSSNIAYLTFPLFVLYLLSDTPRSLDLCMLQAARQQRSIALNRAGEAYLRPVLIVAMVYLFGVSVLTLAWAQLIIGVAAWLATTWLVRRVISNPTSPIAEAPTGLAAAIRQYALPLVPMAGVAWVTAQSDRYIIGAMAGLSATGVYGVIYGLTSQPFTMAQGVLALTLSPIYYSAASRGDTAHASRIVRTWAALTALICGAGVLLFALLHNPIANLLVGKNYRAGAVLMMPIAIGSALNSLLTVFETRLYARKRTDRLLISNTITAVASLFAVPVMVHFWGVIGAAYAAPIYFGIGLIVTVWLGNKN